MAEKQTNKDRMREIVDSIENGIKELFESDMVTLSDMLFYRHRTL